MKFIVTPFILVTIIVLTGLRMPDADEVALEGVIRPKSIIELRSNADGILESVLVEKGDRVQAGQTLACLAFEVEAADLAIAKARTQSSADLELAEAELTHAASELSRNQKLSARGVITPIDLDVFVRDHRLAEIRVQKEKEKTFLDDLEYSRSKARYAQRKIHSPIDGVVIEKIRSKGEMVNRTGDNPVLRIAQLHPLSIDVRAPLDLLGKVKPGQTVLVHCDQYGGPPRRATVKIIDRVADAASETFGLRIQLPNTDYTLTAGLRCRVSFPKP